jgi:hypothetical protein
MLLADIRRRNADVEAEIDVVVNSGWATSPRSSRTAFSSIWQ